MAFSLNVAAQDANADDAGQKSGRKVVSQYNTRVVKGRVLDATTGKPLAGAIVRANEIDGYSALTDDNGAYQLKVPDFATAVYITAPDYNPVVIGLQGGEEQHAAELYVTGFDVDYVATTNVRGDQSTTDFQYTSAVNVKEEVGDQLGAYVRTITRNGTQGIGNVMFIQGLNSLNVNAQPLIVLDGVIIDQQYGRVMLHDGFYNDILSNINPADVEKVEVMRNGTALYGAKGANGVILIKTRRSNSMATRISATASMGVTMLPKSIDMMNAEQYRGYASELLQGTGTELKEFKFLNEDPTNYYYKQYHNNTDWAKDLYRTAFTQNYGVNISGGDEVAQYNLSVGYTMGQSTLECNDYSRLNVRFNTDINLLDKLSVRFDASFGDQSRNLRDDGAPEGYEEGTPTAPSFLGYVKSPFLSPYTYGRGQLSDTHYDIEDESYLNEALAEVSNYNYKLANPYAINEYADGDNKNRFESSMLNLAVTPKYKFNDHLSLSEHFSYNLVNNNEKYYIPVNGVPNYYVASVNDYRENEVRSLYSKQESVMSDTRLDWNNRYGAHRIDLFAGARVNWENYTLNTQLGYNTGNDKTPFLHSGLANAQTAGTKDSWTSVAWYAQAAYDYKSRYYLQANLTAESSSRFGKDADGINFLGAPWGLFWSAQAAWVISNETWFAKQNVVNYLRLTAGYDVSGNDDIDIYAARSYFRASKFLNAISGLTFAGIGNTGIKWETTGRFNVGLETNMFNNRLNLTANLFKSVTTDLLTNQTLNMVSGLEQNWSNGGELKNAGFDVAATVKVLALKDWRWQVGASVGHYENEITDLPLNKYGNKEILTDVYGGTVLTKIGESANLFYGYKTDGVFATAKEAKEAGLFILAENGKDKIPFEAGDMRFVDFDGNKEINEKDRTIIGDPNPDFYGNIFTSLAYKRLKFDVRFNYSVGNDVYNYMRAQLEGGNRFMNQTTAMVNRWQVEGQQAIMPRATFQDPMGNSRFSDRWIEDGSYLKLKSVTLSYDLPMTSEYLQGIQFWVQGNNLLTLTKYLGTDPESAMTSSVIGQGIDLGRLPQSTSIVAGVKINL
jgi:TonB-linked SusC/RagA family outer membrane protein